MQRSRAFVAMLCACASLGACTSPSGPLATELVGTWSAGSPALRHSMTFGENGSMIVEVSSKGSYPGQHANELSSYTRVEGSYEVTGDRLMLSPVRVVTWDYFYGPDSPEQISEPPSFGFYDDARYDVRWDRLTLHYTTYPADAPVPTTRVLRRDR